MFLSSFVAVKPWKYTRRYSTLFFIYLLQKKSQTKAKQNLRSSPLLSFPAKKLHRHFTYLLTYSNLFSRPKAAEWRLNKSQEVHGFFLKGERSSYLVTIAVITRQVWANESLNVTDGSNRWSHVEPISLKWKPREEGVRGGGGWQRARK